jgi:hypothetical protein
MMQTMTRGNESSAATGYLLVALELSQRWWKVGFTTGMGHRVRTRRIAAGALEPLAQAIADAKRMFGLATDAPVISCYEWSVRFLSGLTNTRSARVGLARTLQASSSALRAPQHGRFLRGSPDSRACVVVRLARLTARRTHRRRPRPATSLLEDLLVRPQRD